MTTVPSHAPGWPGIDPRWTSSAKTGLGTALNRNSRVWFTLSHGILNEIYHPDVDQACTRDMGLLVTDGGAFFSEEKRHARSATTRPSDGVPAYRLVNTCIHGRYRIEKEILTDPKRSVLLQRTRFTASKGASSPYRLHVLLAPHLGNRGRDNTAWVGEREGRPMLFAEREGRALALATSTDWLARSVGFVGVSDGWQDLRKHGRMTWRHDRAENGNVALIGELGIPDADGDFLLALGFGDTADEAAARAASSLAEGFEPAREQYAAEWRAWHDSLEATAAGATMRGTLEPVSAAVLRTCESKEHRGGIVASLSIPWGAEKGDDDLGGYHLVWPRDLVETAGALLAIGAVDDVLAVLDYLQSTQLEDGHWPQNTWTDGRPYWLGVQLDETAFPILLVDLLRSERSLPASELERLWPMLRRAASFLVTNGPVTPQDRWEEDPGYSPFTLAVVISALLAAAAFAEARGEGACASYLRATADCWNDSIERWTYVRDTPLARQIGVEGYYVRIAPPEVSDAASPAAGFVPIKNRPPGSSDEPAERVISPDALALVRFGLRAADDRRIVNTVKVIDALLKVQTPRGPAWHRYNFDGYGEHADGAAFDGVGIGRAWPLLGGERAHFELAAGRPEEALRLLRSMEAFANEGGLIPEQVWDSPDVSTRELYFGGPTGSAMPLVWAHSEYLKLCRSVRDGRVFDLPAASAARYLGRTVESSREAWRFNHRLRTLPPRKLLRVEVRAPAVVHWTDDDWLSAHDAHTADTGLGMHVVDLGTDGLAPGRTIRFTFRWTETDRWEGADFTVRVAARPSGEPAEA